MDGYDGFPRSVHNPSTEHAVAVALTMVFALACSLLHNAAQLEDQVER